MRAVNKFVVFILLWNRFLSNNAEEEDGFRISAVTDYVAFSGDILVSYFLPSGTTLSRAVLQLLALPFGELIKSVEFNMPISTNGKLTYGCGLIDKPGTYLFRMLNRRDGDILAESEHLVVRWPNIRMQIPPEHETSTGAVTLSFNVESEVKCKSQNQSAEYKIEVRRYQYSNDKSKLHLMHNHTVPDFTAYDGNDIKLECSIFDEAGIYDVLLTSNRDPYNTMATSNEMDVTWFSDYAVSVEAKSILPCDNTLSVYYDQPACAGHNDKIRLFKQVKQVDTSVPGLTSQVYITEERALPGGEYMVSFDCDNFQATADGYCFKYVSTARSKASMEQSHICLQTKYTPVPAVDGGWGDWLSWGDCTSTCEDGKRIRYRECNQPEPSGGGAYCEGEISQADLCGTICKAPSTPPQEVYTAPPNCECGCQIATSRGTIVGSASCRGSSVWVVSAPRDHIVSLTFQQYTLDGKNEKTQVYVRNGGTRQSDLLISDNGAQPPTKVETSQNKLWLEFVTPYDSQSGVYGVSTEGFAATFITYRNDRLGGGGMTQPGRGWSMWATTMLLIGVLICIIIIVAAVGFICYHVHNQKNINKKLHQANQALLVNGEPPNSPVHSPSGSTIKGSANLSFGDPDTSPKKQSKKRNYILAKSEPTTPVDVDDIRLESGRKGSPAKGKSSPSKQKVSKSYNSGLSSHVNKNTDASIHAKATANTPSPTYVNSSQGFDPMQHKKHHNSNKPMSPRNEKRNKSFISAVERGAHGAPMAGEEQLSPTTPTNPYIHPPLHKHEVEAIPMESYYSSNQKHYHGDQTAETPLCEQRPPVEGRDSLTRRKSGEIIHEPVKYPSQMPISPGRRATNYVPPLAHRPDIKPLPLRSIQRPDGQSPDSKQAEVDAYSPQSQASSGLSPVLQKTQLFPSRTPSHLDLPVDPDFEYDDSIYVPDLPGSYFSMDPSAYTLTWQHHSSCQGPRTESQHTLNSNNNGSFC